MHCPEAAAPAGGPGLLLQLGQLILRARSDQPHKPTTSQVLVQSQPKVDEVEDRLEDSFRNHINALWTENVPICVEVVFTPSCPECLSLGSDSAYPLRGLLLERWTMTTVLDKSESPAAISSPWLLNAVRSQLHFSQLAAWRASSVPRHKHERRRKLSREPTVKKPEDVEEVRLNVEYYVKTPAECTALFAKPPTDHTFPLTDIGIGKYLKVVLESLPRLPAVPTPACAHAAPRSAPLSAPLTAPLTAPLPSPLSVAHATRADDDLAHRLTDLTIGSRKFDGAINSNIGTPSRRLSIITNPGSTEYIIDKVLDDRMHTTCSENGKHKCNCDDDSEEKSSKKVDERRIKEIAKYKRKVRKESRKFCDSTSSEGERKETTSIPILQASRFDRFRAIGCYRNQTYLTLPASKAEVKSPFKDTEYNPPIYKTNTVSTQTDFVCHCGNPLEVKCDLCIGVAASEGIIPCQENGVRRKIDDAADKSQKKQKCDNINNVDAIIKRPKLSRFIIDKLDKIVTDRNTEKDIKKLHHKTDDRVILTAEGNEMNKTQFENPHNGYENDVDKSKDAGESKIDKDYSHDEFPAQNESKRQKTFSTSDEDLCNFRNVNKLENESKNDTDFKFSLPRTETNCQENLESSKDGFIFPDPKNEAEMDQFRWGFDASPMVFNSKTGLPLTSSPAPLRRGKSCFDFDDSINGISGIKSALSPAQSPEGSPRAPLRRRKFGSGSGLLGSYEESLLQGRLPCEARVRGFSAALAAAGPAFLPPHRTLPAAVRYYGPHAYTAVVPLAAPYRVPPAGSVQVALFNPRRSLVKVFLVRYSLATLATATPGTATPGTATLATPAVAVLRQRTTAADRLLYLIHLRFMSMSGQLFLHSDIRVVVCQPHDEPGAPPTETCEVALDAR